MSISFSGLGSGLPIDEWISQLVAIEQAKVDTLTTQRKEITQKQSALNTLKSEYSSVQSATTKFTDCLYGSGMDFFSKVSVNVSGQEDANKIATASVTQYSTPASLELEVQSLATSTVKRSLYFDAFKNSSNKLSELGVTAESTFEINGASISVNPDMTIDSLVYQINNSSQAGVKASLKSGRLVLENKETGNNTMTITGDFADTLGLSTSNLSYTSKSLDPNATLRDYGVNYSGQVSVHNVSHTQSASFSPEMTVSEFVSTLDSRITFMYSTTMDSDGRILMETGNSFRPALQCDKNSQGKTVFDILGFADSVDAGTDAVFTINGDRKTSSTNTIDSDTTGVLGLSLTLSGTTNGDPLTINITRDYDAEEPYNAIQSFVEAFNKMIVDTKSSTDSQNGGLLSGENTLNNLKTNLRSLVTSPISNSGIYRSLADIGITTGAPGLDVDADTTQLIIDKDKFMEAFNKDPNSVKALLIGDTEDGTAKGNGLMQQIQGTLNLALDSQYGYFSARSESFTSQLKIMDEKIEKKQDYVTRYQEKLQKQFTYMDNMIAQMNSQFSQMQQQLASIGIDMGSSS